MLFWQNAKPFYSVVFFKMNSLYSDLLQMNVLLLAAFWPMISAALAVSSLNKQTREGWILFWIKKFKNHKITEDFARNFTKYWYLKFTLQFQCFDRLSRWEFENCWQLQNNNKKILLSWKTVNMAESCEKIPRLKWPCVLQPLHVQSSTFDRNYLLGT